MNLQYIICIIQLLLTTGIFAQKEYNHKGLYASAGYEIGFLSSDIKEIHSFDNLNQNTSLSHSGRFLTTYKTPFKAEIKLGYTLSYNILPFNGTTDKGSFTIKNNYYSHSFFLGAGYNIPIKKDIDITLGMGSALSYVKDDDIYKEYGHENDKIIATNKSIQHGNAFIIPEITITKYFNKTNFVSLGVKYNHSVNEDFLNISIQHITNNSITKQVDYKVKNNCLAIYLCYGFKFL